MPELPEVEVVKKSLEKTIYDLRIKNIEIPNKFLRYKINEKLMKSMVSSKVLSVSRRSKDKIKNEPVLIQNNIERIIEYVEMPDLYGKSVREAFSELKKIGIWPQISGRGLIISQSIDPGKKIEKKSICILKAEIQE